MGCLGSKEKEPKVEAVKKNEIPEYKIIVIGDSSVGKTAIIHQFINNSFEKKLAPTTGVQN